MNEYRILSIDGGGIRGIIPATILAYLEKQLGEPIMQHFHLAAGTSTGALIAAGLCTKDGQPIASAEEICQFYREKGPEIFHRSWWQRLKTLDGLRAPKYDHTELNNAITSVFGDAMIGDLETNLIIPAYDIENQDTVMFKSWQARENDFDILPTGESSTENNFKMTDVLHATCAAPTYFEPHQLENEAGERFTMVDGGVFANNPAKCAHDEAVSFFGHQNNILIFSLGTGTNTRPIEYEDAKNWGRIGWAPNALGIVFNGITQSVDHHLRISPNTHYLRMQKDLSRQVHEEPGPSDDMDDASPANIARLEKLAHRIIRENREQLDQLVEHLKTNKKADTAELIATKHAADATPGSINLPYNAFYPKTPGGNAPPPMPT